MQPPTLGVIADEIVVLNRDHQRLEIGRFAHFAQGNTPPPAMKRAMIYPTSTKRCIQVGVRLVPAIGHVFFRPQHGRDGMQEIVAPDRVEPVPLLVERRKQLGVVHIAFGDQVQLTTVVLLHLGKRLTDLSDDMLRRLVENTVGRIEPQPVKVELLDPIDGVPHDVVAHHGAVFVIQSRCVSPHRLMPLGNITPKRMQIISLGAKVVINHVQHHGQAALMRRVDQLLKLLGRAKRVAGGVKVGAVITPVPAAGRLGHRHQFQGRDSHVDQFVQPLDCRQVSPLLGKGADVQFVQDQPVFREPSPRFVAPLVSAQVDQLGWAMNPFGLKMARRVGTQVSVGQTKPIARPRWHTSPGGKHAGLFLLHGNRARRIPLELQLKLVACRGMYREKNRAIGQKLGTKFPAHRHPFRAYQDIGK